MGVKLGYDIIFFYIILPIFLIEVGLVYYIYLSSVFGIIAIIVGIGLIIFTINKLTNAKRKIEASISKCPLCKFPYLYLGIDFSLSLRESYKLECEHCGAKWKLILNKQKDPDMVLIHPSNNRKDSVEYLEKKLPMDYWTKQVEGGGKNEE